MLQDSLGLTDNDHVHRVRLFAADGVQRIEPPEVRIQPGAYVEFFTRDRRVRTVSFLLDSLRSDQVAFLRETGQDQSPPLIEMDSRFVLYFLDAPHGRYPFVVEGSDAPARGAVVVDPDGS